MTEAEPLGLTHIDARGRAVMVDVTGKAVTEREAVASCRIVGIGDVQAWLEAGGDSDAWSEARVAGLYGAKNTSSLIPLCHPLPLSDLGVEFLIEKDAIEVRARAATTAQTGVEMEALSACMLAALSLLGRLRQVAVTASIEAVVLLEKRGGRSGTWLRGPAPGEG